MVAIEIAFAQSRKMLAAPEHPRGLEACEKLFRVCNSLEWICRDRTRSHHAARRLKGKVQDRREIHVKSERPAIFSDNLPMLARQIRIVGCEHFRDRRRRPKHIAKTIYCPTFQINAGEKRRRNTLLTLAQQPPGLLRAPDIACEENNSSRFQPFQQGSERRRHLHAIVADDQQLPSLLRQNSSVIPCVPLWLDFLLQLCQQIKCLQR